MRPVLQLVAVLALAANARAGAQDHASHHDTPVPEHRHHAVAESATEPTESERAHVPPAPPERPMRAMSNERMIELMQMEDDARLGMLLVDQLEWREIDSRSAVAWEAQAWYGDDYDKLWVEADGTYTDEATESRVEALWDHIIGRWWSLQTGVRRDVMEGESRTWGSIGVRGTAPYFVGVEAALYVGSDSRAAARFSAEYDILITQRLILQPELEFEAYSKNDPENGIGTGISDVEVGLRLRYEIRREIAPYLGVHWERKLGGTGDYAREAGREVSDLTFVAGLRAWF